MRFRDIFRISFFNTKRAKWRSALTALAICVGVSSVMLISTLGDSGSKLISNEIDKLGISGITIYSKNEETLIDDEYVVEISKNVPLIDRVQPLIIETGTYYMTNSSGSAVIWGIDSNVEKVISLEVLHGTLPSKIDVTGKNHVAVIDSELANSTYKRTNVVGKEIILRIGDRSERFEIIGVVASQKDGINQVIGGVIPNFIYVPYKTLGVMRGDESLSQIAVACHNAEDNDRAGKMATDTLSRISGLNDAFGYENINTYVSRFKEISVIVTLLISAIAAISLIVAGLGIMNTMLASTGERKKEIGIMMAIGANRRDIAFCFIMEAAIVAAIGGIAGAGIGSGTAYLITQVSGMPPVINSEKMISVIIVAVLCGIIFSAIPSYRASKLNPIETLHE